MTKLFGAVDLSGLSFPNRIVTPLMSGTRATKDVVPAELMRKYVTGGSIPECGHVPDGCPNEIVRQVPAMTARANGR